MKRVTLIISGEVQAVGFRTAAVREANKLGLTGYVKNLPAGSVEVVAEGEEGNLNNFIIWCYNGVGLATVSNIKTSWTEATGVFSNFVIVFES
ncbi:MAG: acylphosphatase [Patescibacteria group bacterium]|nr:acylphosphatase [Patescibacteria group bacterium]